MYDQIFGKHFDAACLVIQLNAIARMSFLYRTASVVKVVTLTERDLVINI